MLKSEQEWAGLIVCKDATGALSTPSAGPVGALYVNGVVDAAGVTVSGSNPYKWTVTLPALNAGDLVSMYVTATIDSIATAEIVAEDVVDTYRTSDIEALVDDIGEAGAGLTAVPWNSAWDAEVESEAMDALNVYDPPTNTEMEARTLPASDYFDPTADTVAAVTTVASLGTGAITAAVVATGAIDADAIADNAIDAGAIATGAITAAKFAAGAVDAEALSNDAIDAILDEVVEGTLTVRHILRLLTSFIGAKVSGGGTTTITFRDIGDTKPRITMTVDADSGDRSAVALDGS